MTLTAVRAWILALATLALAILACANPLETAAPPSLTPTSWPTVTRPPSPTPSSLAAFTPGLPGTPVPLAIYAAPSYRMPYPRGWGVTAEAAPGEWLFAPAEGPSYGILVRVEGSGYDAAILEALINSEREAMRREGFMPEEIVRRRAATIADEATIGRTAEFLAVVADSLVRMRVTAVVAGFSTAYVLRLWAPVEAFDDAVAGMYDQVVYEFTPLQAFEAAVAGPPPSPTAPPQVAPSATATASATLAPADTATPTPALPTVSPPPGTAALILPLASQPYQGEGFVLPYPAAWVPTENLDGTVNVLAADPNLPVGISARSLGTGYDPARAPAELLEVYLAEVSARTPGVILSEQWLDEAPGGLAQGLSTTYVVPLDNWRLVYRATVLVSRAGDGAAYRLLQWAPETFYEAGYRELYRAVVAGFRPVPAASPQEEGE